MANKKVGIKPHVAMRALYVGAPKKFKLGDVPEGELVIVALQEVGEPDVYCAMIVQKQSSRTTRLFSVGPDEMTTYHTDVDCIGLQHQEEVVWLVQATMPVARIPDRIRDGGKEK